MKLFLASSLDKTLHRLKEVAPGVKGKVIFVANAAEPWASTDPEPFWVANDHHAFIKEGFEVIEVDLHKTDANALSALLAGIEIIHICGGGVFYINELIKERGVGQVIYDAVANKGVIYSGSSAGSIIASKAFSCYEPEEEEVLMVKNPSDKVGLGFLDFVVVPHNDVPAYIESHSKLVMTMPQNPEALVFIRDNQAVWVEDDTIKILSV